MLCALQDQSKEENNLKYPAVPIPWPVLKSLQRSCFDLDCLSLPPCSCCRRTLSSYPSLSSRRADVHARNHRNLSPEFSRKSCSQHQLSSRMRAALLSLLEGSVPRSAMAGNKPAPRVDPWKTNKGGMYFLLFTFLMSYTPLGWLILHVNLTLGKVVG